MKQLAAFLAFSGLAVMASAEPPTQPVTITLGHDDGAKTPSWRR